MGLSHGLSVYRLSISRVIQPYVLEFGRKFIAIDTNITRLKFIHGWESLSILAHVLYKGRHTLGMARVS